MGKKENTALNHSIKKSAELIKKRLESRLGIKLIISSDRERFSTGKNEGQGIRMFVDDASDTRSIRFNYENSEITSIDIWGKGDDNTPDVRLHTTGISILKVLPLVYDQLKDPSTGLIKLETNESLIVESLGGTLEIDGVKYDNIVDAVFDMLQSGDTKQNVTNKLAKYVSTDTNNYEVVVTNGAPEVNIDVEEATEDVISTIPVNELFNNLTELAKSVAKGHNNALIVYGSGGTGKTHTITVAIEEEGLKVDEDYKVVTGKATPKAIYEKLYRNNGKVIIFDDCDNALKNQDAVNLLKGALDTHDIRKLNWEGAKGGINPDEYTLGSMDELLIKYLKDNIGDAATITTDTKGKNTYISIDCSKSGMDVVKPLMFDALGDMSAEASSSSINDLKLDYNDSTNEIYISNISSQVVYSKDYNDHINSGKLPMRFEFTGRVIFITNLELDKIPQALQTRGPKIGITLTSDEILDRIESNISKILPSVSTESKMDVLKVLRSSKIEGVNFRTFITSVGLKESGATNWKQLATRYA